MGIPVSRIIQAALVGTGVLYAVRWLGRKMETSKAAEIPANGKRVLMILTNSDRMPDSDKKTGVWLEEFSVPYRAFRDAGCEVIVASVNGGRVPIDPNSETNVKEMMLSLRERGLLRDTPALRDVYTQNFDAVFFPGGHGTMTDFPDNGTINQLLNALDRDGKIIAAVCHGPAAFIGVQSPLGTPLIEGKRITAFADSEEQVVGLFDEIPFSLVGRLRESGAKIKNGDDFVSHVLRDGNWITGQNPASSEEAAREVLNALGVASAQIASPEPSERTRATA